VTAAKMTLMLTVDKATLQRRCTYSQNMEGRKEEFDAQSAMLGCA